MRQRASSLFAGILAAALLHASPGARAQDATATSDAVTGVVELFTSQGCASCPPAEAVVSRYAKGDRGVVALAYHVDYWDYIGWQDPLGSRRNAERQKDYAKKLRLGALVTPQVIVNGAAALPGADEAAIAGKMAAEPLRLGAGGATIRLARQGDTLHIVAELGPGQHDKPAPVLILVTFVKEVRTKVMRGENKGRELVATHAVRDWRVVGEVAGEPLRLDMPIAMLADPDGGKAGGAALLQAVGHDDKPGRILAAAAIDF